MSSSIYCVLADSQTGEPVRALATATCAGPAAGGAGTVVLSDDIVAQEDVVQSAQCAGQLLLNILARASALRILWAWLCRGAVSRIVIGWCGLALLLAVLMLAPYLPAVLGVRVDTSGLVGWPELIRSVATGMCMLLLFAVPGVLWVAQRSARQCKALAQDLRGRQLTIHLANPQAGAAERILYGGNSGGLAFLLALARAIPEPRRVSTWIPWLHALAGRAPDLVCTAAVNADGEIGRVGQIADKLRAITSAERSFWILSNQNYDEVREYYGRTNNRLVLTQPPHAREDYRSYCTQDGLHTFLFIEHIGDLARFFAPRRRRILPLVALSTLCLALALGVAWLAPGLSAPEFMISQCGMASQTTASNEVAKPGWWEADQSVVTCVVSVKSSGYPGPLDIEVQSSADGLLSGDAEMGLVDERRHIARRISGTQPYSFFVRRDEAGAPSSYVIVGVVVRNMAGRQSSASVVLAGAR
jgi:hypothetical protein